MARKPYKFKTRTRADVEASMTKIKELREAVPTHDEIGPVLEAAGKRFGIPVATQADRTGIERRHIYARHPAAKPVGDKG